MPKLPNAERADAPLEKFRDYALNPAHIRGGNKARVFASALGFTQADAGRLRAIVLDAASHLNAVENTPNEYGRRFVVDIPMIGLRGGVTVRSTWIVRNAEDFPRLTSCYML